MKNDAIMRIVIWSVVIVVLLAIMVTVMFSFGSHQVYEVEMAATEIADYVTSPAVELTLESGFVTDNVNIRTAPNVGADTAGMLEVGSRVEIGRTEMVNGQHWAYITYPQSGWVVMDYISESSLVPHETSVSVYIPEPGEKNSFTASEISEIEIEWVAGDILIQTGNTDQISVDEDGSFDEKYAMVLKKQGNELKIAFCEDSVSKLIGINSANNLSKDLTITVPVDWVCESLEIEAASASVEVNNLTIREVDFDGASGTCEFENCTVEEIDIDTASGDIRFVGSLNTLDCDAASASVYAVLSNTPSRLDLDTMSGDLDITLPYDAGFALALDGMNMDFESEFETTLKNGNYVCGDGRCRINVDAMSGDVIIRKGEASLDAPTAP